MWRNEVKLHRSRTALTSSASFELSGSDSPSSRSYGASLGAWSKTSGLRLRHVGEGMAKSFHGCPYHEKTCVSVGE